MRTIFIGLALASVALPVSGQTREENVARCGGINLDARVAGCTALIQSGQEPNTKLAGEFINRGMAYDEKGIHDQAIADYTQAIALNPNFAGAYYGRGLAYARKGLLEMAIGDYTQAIALNPDLAAAYSDRGTIYDGKGLHDQAIDDLTRAIKLKPDYAAAYNNRGLAYMHKGLFDQAIGDFTQTIALKPDYAVAYSNRGVGYERKGSKDQAAADFRAALNLQPDMKLAHDGLKRLGLESGGLAQGSAAGTAPIGPIVPTAAQVAANPMPARRAELDTAALRTDFPTIKAIVASATNADEVLRNMNWEELQVVQGGSIFYSFRYLDDLWFLASKLPDGSDAQGAKLFAGVVGLYTLQQIEIDGTRCADPSAMGHRLDQLIPGRAMVFQYVMTLPEVTRRDLASQALKLEARTAKLRRDDPVLCSGGGENLAQALQGNKTQMVAGTGGQFSANFTPVATYVDPVVSAPKQAEARAKMPSIIARSLRLPEGSAK